MYYEKPTEGLEGRPMTHADIIVPLNCMTLQGPGSQLYHHKVVSYASPSARNGDDLSNYYRVGITGRRMAMPEIMSPLDQNGKGNVAVVKPGTEPRLVFPSTVAEQAFESTRFVPDLLVRLRQFEEKIGFAPRRLTAYQVFSAGVTGFLCNDQVEDPFLNPPVEAVVVAWCSHSRHVVVVGCW
jgi:hypothetical protein